MGRPIGPKKVHRYSVEFKLTAVKRAGIRGTYRRFLTILVATSARHAARCRWTVSRLRLMSRSKPGVSGPASMYSPSNKPLERTGRAHRSAPIR